MSGVIVVLLPVDDDGFDEADWLADALAFALADDDALGDDDALVLGVADVLAAGEDAAPCAGAGLVQLAFGAGWLAVWAVPPDVGLGLGDTVGVGVALGLALGLAVALGLLALALAEALALALGLVVLPLLWLPLDDAAGAVAFPLGLRATLVPFSVADGCVDGDAQELELCTALLEMPAPETGAVLGTRVPPPCVLPPFDGLLKAEPMASPTCTIA